METPKMQNGISGQPSNEQLNTALRSLHDLMTRTFVRVLVLGDTAKGIRQGQLFCDKIEAGIKLQDLKAEYVKETLTEWINKENDPQILDDKLCYTIDDVLVEIKILKKKWNFLKDPDILVYRSDEFYIPNPFDAYYKSRYLVR